MNYLIDNINNYTIENLNKLKNTIRKEKLNEINRINKINHKKRKIIGELLLIKGLNQFFSVEYKKLKFTINNNGKTYIKNNKNNAYFNISHSHDYCICAFSNNKIGVDIEKIRETDLNIVNQFTTPKEKKYILKSNQNIYERLFEIYTLKEAYFKMRGENLNNIKNIEFEIKHNKIICSDKTVELKLIKSINNYIIAFCEELK